MTEEKNQGGPARVPERGAGWSAPAFSEPREWTPCPVCDGGDPQKRAFGDARSFANDPCPECGQPPRCWVGVKDDYCPRPATVDIAGSGNLTHCGQHLVENEIQCELQEWEAALQYLEPFLQIAKLVGFGGGALTDLLLAAQAEAEGQITRYRSEISRIWEGG